MRKRKIWLNMVLGLILLLCLASFGTMLMPNSSSEVIIAIVSLDVALLALYISLRTFYSIDEVNAISRMDGNVMENPRYRPNILRAFFRFPQILSSETSEALMCHMEKLFYEHDKQSGAHLADCVQEVADMMILVPFFIRTDNLINSSTHKKKVTALINKMKKSVSDFKEISDGSCKLLEETVSLIDSIFSYQKMTAYEEEDSSKLLEIRGSIFINPVSIILYHNYLGLYFLQRAFDAVDRQKKGLSLWHRIEKLNCSDEDKELAIMYSNKAVKLFKTAYDNIGEDTIWRAFVCFNMSRALYHLHLLGAKTNEDWETIIDESIRNWNTSNQIVSDHFSTRLPSGQVTWLHQGIISQGNKVRLTKILFQMHDGKPLTNPNGDVWVKKYHDVLNTPFFKSIPEKDPQKRTDRLVTDIKELLNVK